MAVPEAIRVLAAAGFAARLVETVGVGQVEVEVAAATDTTVVVVNPRWGDAIQANKAGLLETADIFVINKADMPGAAESRRDLEQMLDLSPRPATGGRRSLETVASTGEGVDALWAEIGRHRSHLEEAGLLGPCRRERLRPGIPARAGGPDREGDRPAERSPAVRRARRRRHGTSARSLFRRRPAARPT